MNLRQAAQQALEALKGSRRSHHYCEDTWYSCPKHEGGCANEAEGDECNCGADKANEKIDQAITVIEQALAEPEQKPVAWYCNQGLKRGVSLKQESPEWIPLYTALRAALAEPEQEPDGISWLKRDSGYFTAPTPRKPVELTDEEIDAYTMAIRNAHPLIVTPFDAWCRHFSRAVIAAYEAKQGEQT